MKFNSSSYTHMFDKEKYLKRQPKRPKNIKLLNLDFSMRPKNLSQVRNKLKKTWIHKLTLQ